MGIVFNGIPPDLALRLKEEYSLEYFIETGTLVGNTAKWASSHFEQVYTAEIAYKYFIRAKMNLLDLDNVQLIYGYSADVLGGLLPTLNKPALIWLDAHWSSDLGYNKSPDTMCPVMKELKQIEKHDNGHVILIDDVRLFGVEDGWPSIDRVRNTLKSMGKIVTFETDVVIATPKNGKS